MAGPDAFYRLSKVKKFVRRTGLPPIRVIVDIGVNVGDTVLLLHRYFPRARIIGFEAVEEYFRVAAERVRAIPQIELHNKAVTAQHLFFDNLAERPRPCPMRLAILKARPGPGSAWIGGSLVGPEDHEIVVSGQIAPEYERVPQPVTPITLAEIFSESAISEIDLLKLDCEGCESSVLGAADPEQLSRIRFITGEYHGLPRFYPVMQHRLVPTHKLHLAGSPAQGSFFAERRDGEADGLLCHRPAPAGIEAADGEPIECNPFVQPPTRWPWRWAFDGSTANAVRWMLSG